MKTYKLYDLTDLAKLKEICSYEFRDKYSVLFDKVNRIAEPILIEKDLTDYIKEISTTKSVLNKDICIDFANDIFRQINAKEDAIIRLLSEISHLQAAKTVTDKCRVFDEVFDKIINL